MTLGVGIGLSTTVFCVVNGGLFKGLPFPNADRIVAVYSNPAQGQPRLPIAVHDLAVIQSRQTSFDVLGAYGAGPYNLSVEEAEGQERFPGGQLTMEAFRALGVQPVLGPRDSRKETTRPARMSCCSGTSCGAIATAAPRISSAGRFAPTPRR